MDLSLPNFLFTMQYNLFPSLSPLCVSCLLNVIQAVHVNFKFVVGIIIHVTAIKGNLVRAISFYVQAS